MFTFTPTTLLGLALMLGQGTSLATPPFAPEIQEPPKDWDVTFYKDAKCSQELSLGGAGTVGKPLYCQTGQTYSQYVQLTGFNKTNMVASFFADTNCGTFGGADSLIGSLDEDGCHDLATDVAVHPVNASVPRTPSSLWILTK